MTIQFNTDKTIHSDEQEKIYFTSIIEERLKRFNTFITRIEAHVSDENGEKDGVNDIRCLLEARIASKQPIAVKNQADSIEQAIEGAIEKLEIAISKIVEKMTNPL